MLRGRCPHSHSHPPSHPLHIHHSMPAILLPLLLLPCRLRVASALAPCPPPPSPPLLPPASPSRPAAADATPEICPSTHAVQSMSLFTVVLALPSVDDRPALQCLHAASPLRISCKSCLQPRRHTMRRRLSVCLVYTATFLITDEVPPGAGLRHDRLTA
jgi:hypothetical protein